MAKPPTASQRRTWDKIASFGCLLCGGPATLHHCGTGAGGRKDHDKVVPLCWGHHLGPEGIDGRKLSKKQWQAKYMLESEMLERVAEMLVQKT